jgi:hypothetical protein
MHLFGPEREAAFLLLVVITALELHLGYYAVHHRGLHLNVLDLHRIHFQRVLRQDDKIRILTRFQSAYLVLNTEDNCTSSTVP